MRKSFWNNNDDGSKRSSQRNEELGNNSDNNYRQYGGDGTSSIEPEAPHFRSVQLQQIPRSSILFDPSTAGLINNNNMAVSNSFFVSPNHIKLQQQQQYIDRFDQKKLVPNDNNNNNNFDSTTEQVPSVRPVGWDISQIRVQTLPLYYSLEKLHASFPKAQLQSVLQSLQDLFCSASLHVHYRDGTGGPTETLAACCTSMEGVEFVVPIWEDEQEGKYVAEVQKTAGDGMLFCKHKYGKRILQAIRMAGSPNKKPAVAKQPMTKDPLFFDKSAAAYQQRQMDNVMQGCQFGRSTGSSMTTNSFSFQTDDDCVQSAFSIIQDMIATKKYDRVTMALDTLIAMSDPKKSGLTTAQATAKMVLEDDTTTVSDVVLYLAFTGDWPKYVQQDEERRMIEDTKKHSFQALTIVAQSLNMLDVSGIQSFSESVRGKGLSVVLPMVLAVKDSTDSPHRAFLAAHILACLCHAIPSVRMQIRTDYKSAVEMACQVGTLCHSALAQASHRLLQELR